MQRSCLVVASVITLNASLFATRPVWADSINTGDRVRVKYAGNRVEGSVVSTGQDTLVLAASGTTQHYSIPGKSITGLQRYAGQRSNWGLGLLIGAGAGAITGFIVTAPEDNTPGPELLGDDDMFDGVTVGYCTVIGALVGTLVGAAIQTDEWETVEPDQYRIGVSGSQGEMRVAFTSNF